MGDTGHLALGHLARTNIKTRVNLPRISTHNLSFDSALRELLGKHGFSIANLSSRLTDGGKQFEYRMVLRSRDPKSAETLSQELRGKSEVVEFRISPTGD